MEDIKKKRTTNFSSDEKRILSELVLKYQDIVENKRTDATTNTTKTKGWIRLAEEFNNISTYCNRTHAALKCCWENMKRQAKKDRADKKKKLFMTGGGKPPSPPPSNGDSGAIVESILGPALEGIPNIYDSDADAIIDDIVMECTYSHSDIFDKENADAGSSETNQNIMTPKENHEHNNQEWAEENPVPSTSKGILKENNKIDTWSSWTPKDLKTPISSSLRRNPKNDEDWLKRRRPKSDCTADQLLKEKIKLIRILQENALKESQIRLAILEEQLKQEKIKTENLNK